MARPKLDIDEEEVEKLASFHCTATEIASFFNCDISTITKRFSKTLEKGRDQGKIKLRKLQWQSAEAGNVTMQIFLGKNILKQSDAPQDDHDEKKQVVLNINLRPEEKIEP